MIMRALLLFLFGILSSVSIAQDGSLDTSFGDEGIVVTDLGNSQDWGLNVAQQTNQKLIVSGSTNLNTGNHYPYLLRYMSDGILDTTFGTDGMVTVDYGSYGLNFLFIDNQQKILVGGGTGQGTDFVVLKYTENGILESGFADNGVLLIPDGNYSAMTLLADGSFLLLKFSGSNEITINHYLSNGDLDTNFGINGSAISTFSGDAFVGVEMKIDGEDNIYFLGKKDYTANTDIILMKFHSNGYLDTTFGNNGKSIKNIDALNPMNFSSASLDFTNDNKIVIAGSCGACLDIGNPVMQPYFIRYQNDGLLDPDFGNNGTVLLPVSGLKISQLIIQENQRMLVSGKMLDCFEGSVYAISRYFSDGTADNSFIYGTTSEFDNYKTILQQDGKIVTAGNTFWYNGQEDIVLIRHSNNTLSVPDFENRQYTIYPNPSNGIFIVERDLFYENETYQITDITGKIIGIGELSERQSQINLTAVQNGVYFLKTSSEVFRMVKN